MRAILTAAEMRRAEARAITDGSSVERLMARAGAGVADVVRRLGGGAETLVLCGVGNNGGDGYVAARLLADGGLGVRVAAAGEPRTPEAIAARDAWGGPVEPLGGAQGAPILVDALFGTGLSRPLDTPVAEALARLCGVARRRVAIDLPSGVSADDGALLSPVPAFDVTVALGALKPAHRLQPAAALCGSLIVADIGIEAQGRLNDIVRPLLPPPGPEDHKYSRGMVAVVGGSMPGAALLAASAAQRAGAGYVLLNERAGAPPGAASLVRRPAEEGGLDDARIGAVVVGPGLAAADEARAGIAIAAGHPLVIDAGAIALVLPRPPARAILTPHEGEFIRAFGMLAGSRVDRARRAAVLSGAVVLLKGADSVVAAPDGRAAIAPSAPAWLASAGTGDVLAGIVGAMLARGLDPFDAACAAVWLHSAAARAVGPGLIADDLLAPLPMLLGLCG